MHGHIEHDDQADVADPAVLGQQLGDEGRGEAHQRDGQDQAEDHDPGMFMRGTGNGQHIVQRHGDIGDHDLKQGRAEGLALDTQRFRRRTVAVMGGQGSLQLGLGLGLVVGALLLQFTPHLPADPQQQDAAGEQQADDSQQLHGDQGEADPQHDGRRETDQDRLLALFGREGRGGETDRDGVVAGQHQVDHQHLAQGGSLAGEFGRREEFHGARLGQ